MPPFLPRKRSTPPVSSRPTSTKRARLADALDAEATNRVPSLAKAKTFSLGSDDSSSDSSLSDVDSDQFEDVEVPSKHGRDLNRNGHEDEDEDEEEDIEWEDAGGSTINDQSVRHTPMANGPIQITLRKDEDDVIDYGTAAKAGSGKKGPSRREKQVRIITHQLHVQYLLWHNAIRNSWIGDKAIQDILVKQLPAQIKREVDKWKRASGLVRPEATTAAVAKGKKRRKTKGDNERSQRDWGQPSLRLEAGKPDMSHGDPLIMLMKVLSAYWKKRFAITAPGLRKRGYGTKHGLKQDIASLRVDEHDPEKHGERIRNLAEFRKIAEKGQGSRDVGAQLFTALLRGLGIEARLVASLQPSGYGWTKNEQMLPRKAAQIVRIEDSSSDEARVQPRDKSDARKATPKKQSQRSSRGSKVISLDTDDDDNADRNGNKGNDIDSDDDEGSVVDVTPSMPKAQKPKYDRDLVFPVYWTEAVSPITNKVLAVSPLVLETPVATSDEILSLFEPRGAKAEKGRQIMAYVVAYSSDGTAKDVTVRYLKNHIWPGKTKGVRLPVEKVPIYDKRGKVKRYEDYDWFKYILSLYVRSDTQRTAVDDIEDSTDLLPQQLEKKNGDEGVDTLQSLKSSADFALERFLRREEALKPEAKPVRTFVSGKGDKYKEEPVYRRSDVVRCLTAESWHKEGRQPKLGETPMKMVPVRAVTLTRKREAEEHERQYGEKQTQGLYSWDQTEYIIPPPIRDGIIPKNAYGNMDCFVPSMVPEGAVHVPLKGTMRICKKLDIDFAEAVTGFEFGNKRAVPVCTGVVIAKENEQLLKDAWTVWNEEQRRKEETKMEKLVLDMWRKFVLGLRIRERVQDMYGDDVDGELATGLTMEEAIAIDDEDDQQVGGFMPDEEAEEGLGGGFLLPHEEHATPMEDLVMDHQIQQSLPDVDSSSKRRVSTSDVSEASEASHTSNQNSEGHTDNEMQVEIELLQAESSKSQRKVDRETSHDLSERENNPRNGNELSGRKPYATNFVANGGRSASSVDATDMDGSDGTSGSSDNEDEEIYKPRSTRTRAAKTLPKTKAKVTPRQQSKPDPSISSTSAARSKRRSKKTSMVDEDDESSESTPVRTPNRRASGKPAKGTTASKDRTTPKRSTRLLRKESTIVTSPYFGQ